MNSSPTMTGGVAITAGMLSAVIVWLCGVVRVTPPPPEVAAALAALVLYAAHQAGVWVNRRWPPPPAPPAAPPVAPPAQP